MDTTTANRAQTAACPHGHAIDRAKVNTDEQGPPAGRLAIRSMPAPASFRHDREVARHAGVMEPSRRVARVGSHA